MYRGPVYETRLNKGVQHMAEALTLPCDALTKLVGSAQTDIQPDIRFLVTVGDSVGLYLPVLNVEMIVKRRVGRDFVFDTTNDHARPVGPGVVRQVLPGDLDLGGGVLDTPRVDAEGPPIIVTVRGIHRLRDAGVRRVADLAVLLVEHGALGRRAPHDETGGRDGVVVAGGPPDVPPTSVHQGIFECVLAEKGAGVVNRPLVGSRELGEDGRVEAVLAAARAEVVDIGEAGRVGDGVAVLVVARVDGGGVEPDRVVRAVGVDVDEFRRGQGRHVEPAERRHVVIIRQFDLLCGK